MGDNQILFCPMLENHVHVFQWNVKVDCIFINLTLICFIPHKIGSSFENDATKESTEQRLSCKKSTMAHQLRHTFGEF